MMQIELLAKASEEAANWAHHGSTCRGWSGYSVNENGDRCSHSAIPEKEKHLWWQAFDEAHCSCGLRALRKILWNDGLSETYCKQEIKRIDGYGATRHHVSNIASLQAEVDTLRAEVVEVRKEQDKTEQENAKLTRKLAQIQSAATV